MKITDKPETMKRILKSGLLIATFALLTSARAAPSTVSYKVNLSEFPGAAIFLILQGKFPVAAQGTLPMNPTTAVAPVFLLDRVGKVIGIDVIFPGKPTLNFTQANTARAALTSTGPAAFLPGDWKIKLYRSLDGRAAFKRYLSAQQLAGGYVKVKPDVLGSAQQELTQAMVLDMQHGIIKPQPSNTPDFGMVDREVQRYNQEVAKAAYAYLAELRTPRTAPTECSNGYQAGPYSVPPSSLKVKCKVTQTGKKLHIETVFTQTGQHSALDLE